MKIGERTITFDNPVYVTAAACCSGKKEAQGPLASTFDTSFDDTTLGQDSWEKAESALQKKTVLLALKKANLKTKDINFIFAGDLLNQCISSAYGLRELNIPYLGQYGACSTMAQTLGLASMFVSTGMAERTIAVTSSHFCSAERQYRYPLEYGGQRAPTAQWTVTGSGALILSKSGNVQVKGATFGKIIDLGVKDIANMGAAMAPAAADTIEAYFNDTGDSPENYDLILTGDLGAVGSSLVEELCLKDGLDIQAQHNDGGLMIYHRKAQDVHAGGSGCGCSALVLCGYVLDELEKGNLKNVLFIGTGALMSPTSNQQGETIPCVAHLIVLQSCIS